MKLHFDTVFINANLATMDTKIELPYGAIKQGALGVKDGQITWLGKMDNLPKYKAKKKHDCKSGWITPGLIDCHTHIVFGGNRARECEQRLQGVSYEEIARNGGGINATVEATRAASFGELYTDSALRLINMMSRGVTTIEIKSGYGLNLDSERKMLEIAKALGKNNHIRVIKTFLGAHAVPIEYAGDANGYIDAVCDMIAVLARAQLIDAVDGFCETIGFSPRQICKVFETAQAHGLPVKLHAEQLSNQGGAKLAAKFGALSADHLEYLCEGGVKAMAKAGTVAVLLPGAFYTLQETQKPPIDLLRKYGVPVAVATDCNPGSSPITSPQIIRNMACTLFGFTPEEALAGMTREGAKALGKCGEIGTLEVGKSADLAIWEINHPSELSYWMGDDHWPTRVMKGHICD